MKHLGIVQFVVGWNSEGVGGGGGGLSSPEI
jgi:hypothetical protein